MTIKWMDKLDQVIRNGCEHREWKQQVQIVVGQPAGNFPKGWTAVTGLGSISLEPSECGCLATIRIRQVVVLCR